MEIDVVSVDTVESTTYVLLPNKALFKILDTGQKKTPAAIYLKVGMRRGFKAIHESGCIEIETGDVFPPFPDDREVVHLNGKLLVTDPR